jgi:hypothetical protein
LFTLVNFSPDVLSELQVQTRVVALPIRTSRIAIEYFRAAHCGSVCNFCFNKSPHISTNEEALFLMEFEIVRLLARDARLHFPRGFRDDSSKIHGLQFAFMGPLT